MTASREKLVVLLYDGALRFLAEARAGFESNAGVKAHEAASRAFGVVSELRASLDHERGGSVSKELDRLYVFVQGRILLANRTRDAKPLAEAIPILATLKEGWDGILHSA